MRGNAWADASAQYQRWMRYHYGDDAESEMQKLYPAAGGDVERDALVAPPDTPPPPPPPPPVPEKPTTPHYAAELTGGAGPYVAPAAAPLARPPASSEPTPGGTVPPTLPEAFRIQRSSGPRVDLPNAERVPTTQLGVSASRGLGVNANRPVAERTPEQAQQLYNPDDAETAVYNALRDLGVDAYKSQNPVATELLQNAKGITDAYYIDLALRGVPHSAEAYQQYLRRLLGGGTVPKNQLKQAAERLPQLVPQLREYVARNDPLAGGGSTALPYANTGLTTLAAMLPNADAVAAMLSRLMNPSIPTSAGRTAYARQVMSAAAQAQRAQADRAMTEQLGSLNDFWTYLLGAGPAPSYIR